MSKYCIRCGHKNPESVDTCESCGLKFQSINTESKSSFGDTESAWKSQIVADTEEKPELPTEELHYTNRLTEKRYITETDCEHDFFYVLSNEVRFSSTEYKVLNSGGSSVDNTGLLRCRRFRYNGKDALFYCTEYYKSLEILLPILDAGRFVIILENLINQISDIRENGFLTEAGLDVRISRIYVDSSTGRVFLTYLPINERCYSDVMYLESGLRSDLANIIRKMPNVQSPELMHLAQMMEEPRCSFANLLSAIRQKRMVSTNTGI